MTAFLFDVNSNQLVMIKLELLPYMILKYRAMRVRSVSPNCALAVYSMMQLIVEDINDLVISPSFEEFMI